MAQIRIGTSGWHYDHWVGPFYPEGTQPKHFIDAYSRVFDAAEINNTFYRLPSKEVLAEWRDATPKDFVFACKASRYITHMKKLKDPKQSSARLFERIAVLGDKLGPLLFQLPPNWTVNAERLDGFLGALPKDHRYAFEFRDESWFTPEIHDILRRHGAAFCAYDLAGRRSPVELTADFSYVRLHGPDGAYKGQYDDKTLKGWASQFLDWRANGKDAYCFFDNDEAGYAAQDARRLLDMIGGDGT